MPDGDIALFPKDIEHPETVGLGNIFQVDGPETGLYHLDKLDDLIRVMLPVLIPAVNAKGTASTPPRYFIRKAFPSMTPRPPGGVQSPSPRTRVESLTTATRLPLLVSSKEQSLLSRMMVETLDTPGVYHTLNQLNPATGALGTVWIFP